MYLQPPPSVNRENSVIASMEYLISLYEIGRLIPIFLRRRHLEIASYSKPAHKAAYAKFHISRREHDKTLCGRKAVLPFLQHRDRSGGYILMVEAQIIKIIRIPADRNLEGKIRNNSDN